MNPEENISSKKLIQWKTDSKHHLESCSIQYSSKINFMKYQAQNQEICKRKIMYIVMICIKLTLIIDQ